jgi:uncharacterized membrane protein YfcA
MLMPALVLVFGPRQAVPIMAIASIMANASRAAAWWREVDWRTTAAYSAAAMPAAALGARTLLALPADIIEAVLGAFFIAMIPYITGIVVSTGPLNTPFFLMHGLVKGAYLGTEAISSIAVYVAKAAAFRTLGALPFEAIAQGLIVGSSLMAGAFIAKRFVLQIDPDRFRLLMDALMLGAGLLMLGAAIAR